MPACLDARFYFHSVRQNASEILQMYRWKITGALFVKGRVIAPHFEPMGAMLSLQPVLS
jgi:hypothetical protein